MAQVKKIRAPRGTADLYGQELERLERLERLCANTARLWGYSGIRTPVFEHTGLFVRSIGEVTDIVEKEMFTIPRQTRKEGADSFTLRPENTAGVVRAYLEHNLHKTRGLAKFSYVGPQFRRERPQKGRLRQFNQMGVEVLGSDLHLADLEVILLAGEVLSRAGLQNLKLRVNSVGCKRQGCRDEYRVNLRAALADHGEKLCGDCLRRLDRNVFRVLDCKQPNCREVCAETFEKVPAEFCEECRARQTFLLDVLPGLLPEDAELAADPTLVRGLDYYTSTVFEFLASGLGAQDAVGGGGRYDGLVEDLGGPSLGATGFALGLERVLLAQEAAGASSPEVPVGHQVCMLPIGDLGPRPYELTLTLRRKGLRVSYDLGPAGKKIGKLLGRAEKSGARVAVIIGREELAAGEANLKDMQTRAEHRVRQVDLVTEIRKVFG
jgi:histidyl-tRNA synthetase